jgi:hypothetical protein
MLLMFARSAIWVNGYSVCCKQGTSFPTPHEGTKQNDDPYPELTPTYSKIVSGSLWVSSEKGDT